MKTWYHVTTYYKEKEFTFKPNLPYYLQNGEDRRNPRVCVTANWRHSLMSIILIHPSREYFIYSTTEQPVNPIKEREKQLKNKQIRKNCNNFNLPPDGFVNKEHWFLSPTNMKLEGVVEIPKNDYLGMMMGFGFCNEPNIDKLKIEPYRPKTLEERFNK